MSYYSGGDIGDESTSAFMRKKSFSDKSIVHEGKSRALCATCGHKFVKGERVHWKTHMSPSRLYTPVSVGVCDKCERDPTYSDLQSGRAKLRNPR